MESKQLPKNGYQLCYYMQGSPAKPALVFLHPAFGNHTFFATLAVIFGRRASFHTICWMAPFMILGRKLRNWGKWPALRLIATPKQWVDCQVCVRNCPMSLDVATMVKSGNMENSECILCGNCANSCGKHAIHFSFSKG